MDLTNTGQALGNPDLQNLFDGVYTNADHGTFTYYPTLETATLGIQPVSMILVYAPGSELPAIGGSGGTSAAHSSLEGGSISIGNLLASAKQEQSTAAVEHEIASTSNIASELRHASHSNIALASSVAGEWARPAAFETVGSEQAINNREDVDAGHGALPADEPAAIDSGAGADQAPQAKAAKTDADRTSMEEPSAPAQEHDFGHRAAAGTFAATMLGEPNGSEIVRALFAGSGVMTSDGAAVPIAIGGRVGDALDWRRHEPTKGSGV